MFAQLLGRIALSLEELKIPYMVIGGQAVLVFGEPRLTRDIDITLGVGPERLADLLTVARSAGWRLLVDKPEEFVERTLVLPLLDPGSGIRIDLIFSYSPYERQALARVHRVMIGNASISFAAVEDVIVHKMVAGRPRDLEDVRGILMKDHKLDRAYIHRWLADFDQSLGKNCVQSFNELTNTRR